jgi:hypothetical protein
MLYKDFANYGLEKCVFPEEETLQYAESRKLLTKSRKIPFDKVVSIVGSDFYFTVPSRSPDVLKYILAITNLNHLTLKDINSKPTFIDVEVAVNEVIFVRSGIRNISSYTRGDINNGKRTPHIFKKSIQLYCILATAWGLHHEMMAHRHRMRSKYGSDSIALFLKSRNELNKTLLIESHIELLKIVSQRNIEKYAKFREDAPLNKEDSL